MFIKKEKLLVVLLLVSVITGVFGIKSYAQQSQLHFGSTGTPLNGLTITWQNTVLGDSIKWGYSSNFEQGAYAATSRAYHDKFLKDYIFPKILPDTLLYYSLFDATSQTWSELFAFKTASPDATPFSFTAMGDSRTNMLDWQMVSNAATPTDLTLFMGDIISNGSNIPEWDNWFNYGKSFLQNNLVYHALGNHDVGTLDSTSNYTNLFVLPSTQPNTELYYSFNYGNAVFICLNSEKPADTVQYNWLLKTLENNKNAQWKFIWFHKPFFTSPVHEHDMDAYQVTWWKAFDDYGVDLIFNGHTHNYQRTVPINRNVIIDTAVEVYGNCPQNGRCQIVTGAAGAPLYGNGSGWFIDSTYSGLHFVNVQVYNDSISIKALTPNYQVIDNFSLVKNFIPEIEYSDTQICIGNAVTLIGTGADSLFWSPAIENGIPFEPTSTTEYNLVASNRFGCADTLTIEIEVTPIYSFNDTLKLCLGDSVFWQGNYYKNEGDYAVNYRTINQCDSIYDLNLNTMLLPNDFEIQGNRNVLAEQVELYQVPLNADLEYFWAVKGGSIMEQIANNLVQIHWDLPGIGEIIVQALNESGCYGDTIKLKVEIENPISNQLHSNLERVLFPNPSQSIIKVNVNQPFTLQIFTLQGLEVLKTNKSLIDLSSLKSGIYMAMLKNEKNEIIHFEKLLKN